MHSYKNEVWWKVQQQQQKKGKRRKLRLLINRYQKQWTNRTTNKSVQMKAKLSVSLNWISEENAMQPKPGVIEETNERNGEQKSGISFVVFFFLYFCFF